MIYTDIHEYSMTKNDVLLQIQRYCVLFFFYIKISIKTSLKYFEKNVFTIERMLCKVQNPSTILCRMPCRP